MNNLDQELEPVWAPGWHLDLEYVLPRVVFQKDSSICYMYDFSDFDAHLRTCGLTTLEYLEGKSFYREYCVQLLKKRMENRISKDRTKVSYNTYTSKLNGVSCT